MPLCKAHIDRLVVNLSPNLYGKGGSLEIAEATADLRKSMVIKFDNSKKITSSSDRRDQA